MTATTCGPHTYTVNACCLRCHASSSHPHPTPTPRPNITISCLNFAVVVLWAQTTTPLAQVWRADVGGMCACGLTAAVALILVAALVLPTAASQEVRGADRLE
jgi:hypothetical protein